MIVSVVGVMFGLMMLFLISGLFVGTERSGMTILLTACGALDCIPAAVGAYYASQLTAILQRGTAMGL